MIHRIISTYNGVKSLQLISIIKIL